MKYPIFNSIITTIESELKKRSLTPTKFNVWKDNTIKATGLELALSLNNHGSGIREITLNFDWDTFREAKLAAALEGLEKHPLLKRGNLQQNAAKLSMDIETAWHFDEKKIINYALPAVHEDSRLEYASEWISALNKELSMCLPQDNVISRWHMEIEGDFQGKYVSDMCLLAYHEFSLGQLTQLPEVHERVRLNLQKTLSRSLRVLQLADKTKPEAAA